MHRKFSPGTSMVLNTSWPQIERSSFQFEAMQFTIYEDVDTQYTMQWVGSSLSFHLAKGPGQILPYSIIEIADAQGGVLDKWEIGPQVFPCGTNQAVFQTKGLKGVGAVVVDVTLTIADRYSEMWTLCQP